MARLAIQQTAAGGTAITSAAVAATGGDLFKNNGRTHLRINNGGAAETAVSITRKTCSYGFAHPITGTVAAGAEKTFGPFPPEQFNDDNGDVTVSCDPATSVTGAAVSV